MKILKDPISLKIIILYVMTQPINLSHNLIYVMLLNG